MHPLTETWWRLFVNRTDGTMRVRGRGWIFDPAPLTKPELSRALSGIQPLGLYATDGHGLARWMCLDADTEQGKDAVISGLHPIDRTTFKVNSLLS